MTFYAYLYGNQRVLDIVRKNADGYLPFLTFAVKDMHHARKLAKRWHAQFVAV
jgi:hypothetical protein